MERMGPVHILFVCTGNTCRSPMAAALAQTRLAELGIPWRVSSAGIHATPGMPMARFSKDALIRRHVPFLQHSSQPVTKEILDDVDYVFTMTMHHKEEILRKYPHMKGKIHELSVYPRSSGHSEGAPDIEDPFGGSDAEYEACAVQLEVRIQELLSFLQANHDGDMEGIR
jgi:protein-tyrosine-phosphatase